MCTKFLCGLVNDGSEEEGDEGTEQEGQEEYSAEAQDVELGACGHEASADEGTDEGVGGGNGEAHEGGDPYAKACTEYDGLEEEGGLGDFGGDEAFAGEVDGEGFCDEEGAEGSCEGGDGGPGECAGVVEGVAAEEGGDAFEVVVGTVGIGDEAYAEDEYDGCEGHGVISRVRDVFGGTGE